MENELRNDPLNTDDFFHQSTWPESLRLWRNFLLMAIGAFLYPVVVGWNAFRLRCSFFEKKRCLVKISGKEIKTSNIAIPSGEEYVDATPKRFLIFFYFRRIKEYIEVDKEIYYQFQPGNHLEIEYVDGIDRLHARIPLFKKSAKK